MSGESPRRLVPVMREMTGKDVPILQRNGGPLGQCRHHRIGGVARKRDPAKCPAGKRIAIVNLPFIAFPDMAYHIKKGRVLPRKPRADQVGSPARAAPLGNSYAAGNSRFYDAIANHQ